MQIELGALAPSLVKQLHGKLSVNELRKFQAANEAISRLRIHGWLSSAETERARQRLVKSIGNSLRKSSGGVSNE